MKTASITRTENTFILKNRWLSRTISIDERGVLTSSLTYQGEELLKKIHHEFQVSINRKLITGYQETQFRMVDGQMEHHETDIRFLDAGHFAKTNQWKLISQPSLIST